MSIRPAIQQLEAFHVRHDAALTSLLTAARRLASARGDATDVAAIRAALAFFVAEMPAHFADKEDSIYPRLAIRSPETWTDIHRLEKDHLKYTGWHLKLSASAKAWTDPPRPPIAKEFLMTADRLANSYAMHRDIEGRLLVVADRVLTANDDAALAAEMKARRDAPAF